MFSLSTSVDPRSANSLVSLDWILSSGIATHKSVASGILTFPYGDSVCSMHMDFSLTTSLPYGLILGIDWLFFCRQTLPQPSFHLSCGDFCPVPQSSLYSSAMDTDTHASVTHHATRHGCSGICDEPLVCRCPSTSNSQLSDTSMTDLPSLKLLYDIFLGHHSTCTRISVFHADLYTIQRSLDLHAIPHTVLIT
ncbi:hypothetical protein MVEN_00050300 [Mycena venus]|uniref:Uncharacterized protein n=1 Tax=Mycena venus TaxID=2733690 RepID=A0A8H6Z7T9_9AGAR|nr:hypothetical protein MVEN_00050300 [Mycena venus]